MADQSHHPHTQLCVHQYTNRYRLTHTAVVSVQQSFVVCLHVHTYIKKQHKTSFTTSPMKELDCTISCLICPRIHIPVYRYGTRTKKDKSCRIRNTAGLADVQSATVLPPAPGAGLSPGWVTVVFSRVHRKVPGRYVFHPGRYNTGPGWYNQPRPPVFLEQLPGLGHCNPPGSFVFMTTNC